MTDIDGWRFCYAGKPLRLTACEIGCPDVSAWIKDGDLIVRDELDYYPSGHYTIPLTVIEFLIGEQK